MNDKIQRYIQLWLPKGLAVLSLDGWHLSDDDSVARKTLLRALADAMKQTANGNAPGDSKDALVAYIMKLRHMEIREKVPHDERFIPAEIWPDDGDDILGG